MSEYSKPIADEAAAQAGHAGRRMPRWRTQARWLRHRADEWCRFDSDVGTGLIAAGGIALAEARRLRGDSRGYLEALSAVHRGAFSETADRFAERRLREIRATDRTLFERVALARVPGPENPFVREPARLLRTRLLVLKAASSGEKGVLALDYSFTFALLAKHFDVHRLAERYHLLLEPSWSGYCDPDILCYLAYEFPVFVQAPEPRDAQFLRRLNANLIPVPVAANWWLDHRVFRPLPQTPKARDVIMVAGWSRFKRHAEFFRALAQLRARGEKLSVTLVGYPGGDVGKEGVLELARHHCVADQIEAHEYVPADEVNRLYNQARVNVLWSRREGCNRSIIEGFFAGTPGIMRAGFNYGHHHEYINELTGRYAREHELPDALLEAVRSRHAFSPREWVETHMTCQRATEIVSEAIGAYAAAHGERWSRPLAVKVSHLNTMRYWDESEAGAFAPDYEFLRSVIRR